MGRHYSMHDVQNAAARAISWAHARLPERYPGCRVHDVQDDPRFQHRGVDLLCELPTGEVLGIEVKGDRQAHRGNYFFELISNLEADTPGCFLYSTADWLFYAFLSTGELHELPLPSTRAWFLENARTFPLRHTQTRVGNARYTTVGATVPVRTVLKSVEGATVWNALTPDSLNAESLDRSKATRGQTVG
jgi:hypothetical protein